MVETSTRQRLRKLLRTHGVAYDAAAIAEMAWRFLRRRPHEADFSVFRRLEVPALFVDVGANRGQSALSFAAMCGAPHHVVSFEANVGNRRYLAAVKVLLRDRFEYHMCGLGEAADTSDFYVPVQGSRRVTGEGSFNRENAVAAATRIDGPYRIEVQRFRIERFDSFPLDPDIVKIDVQGLELGVLRGMGEVLPRSQPLFMIEANPQNDGQILRFLGAHGYTPFERSDLGGLVPARPRSRPLNWFYATDPCRGRLSALFR